MVVNNFFKKNINLKRNIILVFCLSFFMLMAGSLNIFAAPPTTKYSPGDTLDPSCAPGSTNCSVAIGGGMEIGGTITSATEGSVLFAGPSGVLAQDNTNFTFNDSTNQLYAKYAKTDSVEYSDSTFSKAYKVFPNTTYGIGVFMGKSLFSGSSVQTTTSNPTDGSNLSGGVAIGEAILSSFDGAWGISNSVFIGNRIFSNTNYGDPTITVAIGSNIGGTGSQNQGVFLGGEVLAGSSAGYGYSGSYGHKNVAIGRQAMYKTNSGLNTAVGALALARLTTGSNNVAIGAGAGNGVTNIVASDLTGSNNTFLGSNTTWNVDAISNATAVGANVTLSQSNTVILGSSADVGIGTATPTSKLHVVGNTAIEGKLSIYNLTNNTTIGYTAGNSVTSGLRNIFLGYEAGKASTNGSDNVIVGYRAGDEKEAQILRSILIGTDVAGNSVTTSDVVDSVLIGYQTGFNSDESYDIVAIGKNAHYGAAADGNNAPYNNVAIGTDAMYSINSGGANVVIGKSAGYSMDYASNNVAIGDSALENLQYGYYNTAIGSYALNNAEGTENVALGYNSGSNITGDYNTSIGVASLSLASGDGNIALGYATGSNITTGAKNIIIGYAIDAPSATTNGQLSIGNLIFGTGLTSTGTTISTGSIGIGDASPDYRFDVDGDAASSYVGGFFNDGNNDNRYGILIQAGADTPSAGKWIQFNDGDGGDVGTISLVTGTLTLTTTSDQRLKQDITDTNLTLENLMNIKVRDFAYIRDPNVRVHGFVAQELYNAYPDAVIVPNNTDEYWKVSYSQLTPLIVKSIQDLNIKLEPLKSLDQSNLNSLASLVKNFLADAGNGVEKFFAKEVYTEKICVGQTCIDEQTLNNLLQIQNQNVNYNSQPENQENTQQNQEDIGENTQNQQESSPGPVDNLENNILESQILE